MWLRVVDYKDPHHWRWVLTDVQGNVAADHEVTLDPTRAEYAAFVDLAGFLRNRVEPDRRLASQAELVERVGRWIGRQVLGEQIGQALVSASPVVVDVILPAAADFLMYRPLELAYVGEVPLAVQDISLVLQVEGEVGSVRKQPLGERLRLLAVFSLPTGGTALALRRERYALTRLVRRIATRYRRAIELQVLQYGVTRQRMGEALRDGRGWDVVHFSGHGLADGLLLEQPDGMGDLVATQDLVTLLRPARPQLKLVTLSSCLSAAATAAETRRWLQLAVPHKLQAEATASAGARPLSGLARELVARLGCAVLAMRYSVVDDFAIALGEHLYEGLFVQDHALARALQLAIPQAIGEQPSVGAPAISVATPALFGPLATDLHLMPPRGEPDFNVNTSKTAFFPDESARFVGRVGVLARASMILAPRNQQGQNAVVLHGMAGAGKTACAVELAYRHEPVFGALAWWRAPEQGKDIALSLQDLAVALEAQLQGLQMVQATTSEAELARFLPRLTQLLEDQAILLVLDNLESLLTEQGLWGDPAWKQLVAALLDHSGESRVVMTSRILPRDLGGLEERVLVEPIHALSLDEALLLARELPHLGQLIRQDSTPSEQQEGEQVVSGVGLVRRVLRVVQGHPKLLELADAQAGDPNALDQRLATVEETLPGADRLGAFFATGESELAPEQFLETLAGWTRGVAGVLPEEAGVLLEVVSALEESDRLQPVLEVAWPAIWQRLSRPSDAPPLGEVMRLLERQALVQPQQVRHPRRDWPIHTEGSTTEVHPVRYGVHPGVAEAARTQSGPEVQQATDIVLAGIWQTLSRKAMQSESGESSRMVVHAGLAAAPYLLRLKEGLRAAAMLQEALRRDHSPAVAAAMLPLLRQFAEAVRGSKSELLVATLLARAVGVVDSAEGERQLRAVLPRAIAQQDYALAGSITSYLVELLREAGRLREAQELAAEVEGFSRQAGLGRWTQLGDRVRRLQLLQRRGEYERVLIEVGQLREEMAKLSESGGQDEAVPPWVVREATLQAGMFAAQELGRWQLALDFNREVARSEAARDAPVLERTRTRFHAYMPLLELGRVQEAGVLLHACRAVFEAKGGIAELGVVFSALADLEDELGHREDAIAMAQTGLRYNYVTENPEEVATGHFNLANYLSKAEHEPALVVAHRLAATLIRYQTHGGRLASNLRALAEELAWFGDDLLPGSFAELCTRVEQVEGVRLNALLLDLPGTAADGDQALAEVVRLARELPVTDPLQDLLNRVDIIRRSSPRSQRRS